METTNKPQTTEMKPTMNDLRPVAHEEKRVPEQRFSTGAISATIWKNSRVGKDGKKFESCTVNLQRRYADKTGQWQSTNTLRINDLPKAALVLEEAYRYLVLSGKGEDPVEAH